MIGILDRAYNNFETLYKQSTRGVVFVVREKEAMLHEVVESVPKEELSKNIIADETIRLTGAKTKESYPDTLRRVTGVGRARCPWARRKSERARFR